MTTSEPDYHPDLMTGAFIALGSVASVFFLIGLFIGWSVWSGGHASMPTACAALTASDCSARMSEAQ